MLHLHVRSLADVLELGGILGDAAREVGRALLGVILAPAFAFARYVDRCDDDA